MAERSLTELSIPGAVLQPTEAPAPTATPSAPVTMVVTTGGETVGAGQRPITWIVIGLVLLILLISALRFFRNTGGQEV